MVELNRRPFYTVKLVTNFIVEPIMASLVNERNWSRKIHILRRSPSELWETFSKNIPGNDSPRCENLT